MSDPLGLFTQQDPLGLFETNKGAQAPSVSIPGAEQYDEEQRKRKAVKDARTPEQLTKDDLKKLGEHVLGFGEAGYGFAHNISAYLTGIPVTAMTIAGKKLKPEDWAKEFFDNVKAMSYVPKTEKGEKRTQQLGVMLEPFGLSPYTQIGPLSARVSAMGKAKKLPEKSIQERIAEVKQEAPKQPEVITPEMPEWRLEHPIAAETRVREANMKMPSAEDYNNRDANVRAVEEEIQAYEQARSFDEQQAQLEALQKSVDYLVKLNELNPDGTYKNQTLIDDMPYGNRPAQFGFTDTGGRVDENGIPIRADLSMDAQNVQNPLQMNLWGDELPGRTGDGGLPLTRALDKMEPGLARDRAIEQLSGNPPRPLESQVQDVLNRGMSRGQRGAIDPRLLEEGFSKLFHGGREFKQWNPRMVGKGEGMAALGPGLYASDNAKLAEVYKKYGTQFDFDESGNMVTTPGVLNELAVDMRNILDYRAKGNQSKWAAATKALDSLGLRASTRGIQGALQEAQRWGQSDQARKAMTDSGIDGMYIQLGGTMGKEVVIFNPNIIAQVSRADTPIEPFSGISRKQRGAIDLEAFGFKSGDSADKLVKDLLGKKFFAEPPKAENIIADAIKDGKDSRQSINFSAGATLQAMKTKSPLIQGVSRIVQGFKNRADNAIRESVFPVEDSFRKLSKTEVEEVAAIFKDEMFTRQKLTADQVNKLGLSDKQLLAYQKLRDMLRAAYEDQNNARIAAGKEPITELEYYMSSRWQGDFRIPLKDKDGKLAWYVAADNKWRANKDADAVAKQFGLTKGEMSIVKSSRRGSEMGNDLYISMLNVLGKDNPMVKEIKNWLETSTSDEAAAVRGQLKHFEPKNNTRGFVGDRPYKSASAEALDLIQSQINYAKNAHYWAEMQRAGAEVKKILADETLNQTQPRNMEYAKQYWLDQVGFNEHEVIRAIENALRKLPWNLAVSPNQLGRGINNVKNLWVMQKLAVNLGFMASNVMQFGATLPHLLDLQKQYGGNPVTSLINGMLTGTMMATGHKTQQNPKFYKAVAMSPGDNKFLLEAMRYAEDNSVIARSIYDESPIASSFSPYANAMNFAGKTISTPETYLRSIVFMSYAHQLKSSGKFKDNMTLFREAEERTNASMGDYREGERALVFSKLGQLGNAANTLQTFPMNYFNQWSWAAREAGRGNPIPAVTMFVMQAYLAGMMGIPLFSELDRGLEFLKDWLSKEYPQAWAKVKDFNLKEQVLSLPFGEEILYGPLSTQTGLGLTSRAAAPVPSEMVQTPFAPAVDMGTQAVQVGKAVFDPLDDQKRAQALMSMAPTGIQGFLETGPMKDQVAGQFNSETGTTTYGKIRDMAAREATVERTPEEENIRKYGLRAQSEVVRKDLEFITGKRAAQTRNVLRELPDKIYNELRKADAEKTAELVQLYGSLGGDPRTLLSSMETQAREELLVPSKRSVAVQKPAIETVKQYKLLQDTLRKLGYVE